MNVAWVTGAHGLIGSHVARLAPAGWRVRALTREALDITDFAAVRARFRAETPDVVIHCAAMARAHECEAQPDRAWRVNCDATQVLAEAAAGIPLLFLSTDLVFDGRKGLYAETDAVHPLTVYAKTKVAAEAAVLVNPRHLVIRTSLNGGISPTGDRSFTEQLMLAWRGGRAPTLFTDEFRSPLLADFTARAVWELTLSGHGGLFHVAGSERMSRYCAGMIVAQHFAALNPRITRGSQRDFAGPPRSPDTSLDCRKAQALLSFRLPAFSESAPELFAR